MSNQHKAIPTAYDRERAKATRAALGADGVLPADESQILDARFALLDRRLQNLTALAEESNRRMDALMSLALADPFIETASVSEWGDS